jgi:hypothetical protein
MCRKSKNQGTTKQEARFSTTSRGEIKEEGDRSKMVSKRKNKWGQLLMVDFFTRIEQEKWERKKEYVERNNGCNPSSNKSDANGFGNNRPKDED